MHLKCPKTVFHLALSCNTILGKATYTVYTNRCVLHIVVEKKPACHVITAHVRILIIYSHQLRKVSLFDSR